MSAELLRRAAKQMREKAEATTPSPWEVFCPGSEGFDVREHTATDHRSRPRSVAKVRHADFKRCRADAEHIASWHPAVALAVADLLDHEAARIEKHNGIVDFSFGKLRGADFYKEPGEQFCAVARAYLGEDAS